MRVILPGALGSTNTYHIRVRSGSEDLSNLSGGLTSGAYQLQIRLREVDETPGSTVRYSNISYAETGVEILGQPLHSPLLGEAVEILGSNNNSIANAQPLGNLVAIDRAALGLAGDLATSGDVDFYQFSVNFENTRIDPASLEVVFDIDYADGLSRANTVMSVFDWAGRLILTSREGNIADDRPGKPGSSQIDDLSRGTVGGSDPFIGTVELPQGIYFLSVTSDAQMPAQLEQYFQRNPLNPDLRLEPIDSVRRIAEDHISGTNYVSTADNPQIPVLLDNSSRVNFHLGDVALFVSTHNFTFDDSSELLIVDPFTGATETFVGRENTFEFQDFAVHPNGLIYAYSYGRNEPALGSPRDDNSGVFLEINPATGEARVITDDGILTYEIDPASTASPPNSRRTNDVPPREGDGIQFNAITFTNSFNQLGFAVGERGYNEDPFRPFGPTRFDNILYQFVQDQLDPNFGLPISGTPSNPTLGNRADTDTPLDRLWDQAGTNIRERGELLTSPRIVTQDATTLTGNQTNFNIPDGTSVTVIDRNVETTFEYDFGFEVTQLVDGQNGVTIHDGNFFFLDDTLFQLDTGPVITVQSNGSFIRSGTIVTVNGPNGCSRNFELTTGDPVVAPNIAVNYTTTSGPEAIVSSLAAAINAAPNCAGTPNAIPFDVVAFVSQASGRLTVTDPTPDLNGQFGLVGATVSFGNANQLDATIPTPSPGIRVEGDNGEAPVLQAGNGTRYADGMTFQIDTASTGRNPVTFEFESGYVIQIPQTFAIQVPFGGGRVLNDGEIFTIDANVNDATPPLRFEIENVDVGNGVAAGNIAININGRSTQDQVASVIAAVVQTAVPSLSASNQGNGYVHLGVTGNQLLDTSQSVNLTRVGQQRPIADGEVFSIGNGTFTRNFEFDSDGMSSGVGSVINASRSLTADQIAANVATQINGAFLGFTSMFLENGKVAVHDPRVAAPTPVLSTTNAPSLTTIGRPGVVQPPVSSRPHVAVPFLPSSTFDAQAVATAIAGAINAASVSPQVIRVPDGAGLTDGDYNVVNDNGTIYVFEWDDTTANNLPANTVSVSPTPPGFAGTPDPDCTNVSYPAGSTCILVPFVRGGVAQVINAQGALTATPILSTTSVTNQQRLFNAISTRTNAAGTPRTVRVQNGGVNLDSASVIVSLHDLTATAEVVGDKVVVNGVAPGVVGANIYIPGTAPLTRLIVDTLIPTQEFAFNANGDITADQIARDVAASVTAHPDFTAGGAFGRINFHGATTVDFSGVQVNGLQLWRDFGSAPGVAPGNVRIEALASDLAINTDPVTGFQISGAVPNRLAAAINNASATKNVELRNFANVADGDFFTIDPDINDTVPGFRFEFNSSGGVTAGSIPINFNPGTSPAALSALESATQNVINNTAGVNLQASGAGVGTEGIVLSNVTFSHAFGANAGSITIIESANATDIAVPLLQFVNISQGVAIVDPPFTTSGEGPGGQITGIAEVNGRLFVVSDAGGFYVVNNPQSASPRFDRSLTSGATTTYIRNSADDLVGIQFAGLTAGPRNVESGAYSNMLFAVDVEGRVYAFDVPPIGQERTAGGELQPIFLDGATHIETGLTNVTGLEFSTLDTNLFHIGAFDQVLVQPTEMDIRLGLTPQNRNLIRPILVDEQQDAPGHGVNATFDTSRPSEYAGSSFVFGQGNVNGSPRGYDFPGGAYGTLVSNEFDLTGYTAADRPVLYFNYYAATENKDYVPLAIDDLVRDSFRIFISDDNGDWELLGTNNEFDDGRGPFTDELNDISQFEVQPIFDFPTQAGRSTADWRQVRIPLDEYAGRDNVRLRFDFSTAGEMDLGSTFTTGSELRAVAGVRIQDGDTVQIDNRLIEFDSGLTLVTPSGSAIPARETLSITDTGGQTVVFEFVDSTDFPQSIVTPDGTAIAEGDTFTVGQGGNSVQFEFDSGYLIQLVASNLITDGNTFIVNNGTGSGDVLFEFDKNGVRVNATAVPINAADDLTIVVPNNGAASLIDGEQFSLNNGSGPVVFEFDRDGVVSAGTFRINIRNPIELLLPAAGGGFGGVSDGDTFTIDPDFNDAVPPTVFEFDSDGVATAGSIPIQFNNFTTQSVLAQRVVTAIQAAAVSVTPVDAGNGIVRLLGISPTHLVDTTGTSALQQRTAGLSQDDVANLLVSAIQANGLGVVPVNAGNGRVVLQDTTSTHTLSTGGSALLTQTTTPKSADDMTNRVLNAIQSRFAASEVTAIDLGGGLFHLQGSLSHTINTTASSLVQSNELPFVLTVPVTGAAAFSEGETFTIRDNQTNTVETFEFDTNGSTTAGNRPIAISVGGTPDDVANAIALAISNSSLTTLNPVTIGAGNLHIGGTVGTSHTIDVSGTPNASQRGTPGVSVGNFGILFLPTDTSLQTAIRVADAISLNPTLNLSATLDTTLGNVVQLGGATFNPGNSSLIPQGNQPIFVHPTQTPADVAAQIAQAIRLSSLGASVIPHFNNDPNLDGHRINLEGASSVQVSAGAATHLAVVGNVGVTPGNVIASINTSMSRDQVAVVLDGVLEQLFSNPALVATAGDAISDGDSFILNDSVNAPATFEFDSGFVMSLPPAGSNELFGGVKDGVTFTITDPNDLSQPPLTFEFDKDHLIHPLGAPTVAAGNTPILIADNASGGAVARAVANAVNTNTAAAALGLRGTVLGGGEVQLGGRFGQILTFSPGSGLARTDGAPFILEIPEAGGDITLGGIRDGATITFTDGATSITYEFDKGFGVGTDANGNVHRRIGITDNFSQSQVATAILSALRSSGSATLAALGIDLNNSVALAGGSRIRLAGTTGTRIELSLGNNVTQPISEPGVTPTVSIQVPQTLTLQVPESLKLHVPAAGGQTGGIVDGETFVLDDDATDNVIGLVFEFDNNNSVRSDANGIQNIPVFFTATDSADRIALSILDAIASRPQLALSPTKFGGDGNIDLGGTNASLTLPTGTRLIRTGPFAFQLPAAGGGVGGILDGGTFDIDLNPFDAIPPTRFEFDSNNSFNAANIRIGYTTLDDANILANRVITTVKNTFNTLHPQLINGPSGIEIGGFANTSLVTSDPANGVTSHLTQTGVAGGLIDSNFDSFIISDGVNPQVIFELDLDGAVSPANSGISIKASSLSQNLGTQNQIAGAIINAIVAAGVGLTPRYLGDGTIHLGGTALHQLDTERSRSFFASDIGLTQSGQPGPIADGETFLVAVGGGNLVFEFDNDGSATAGRIAVPFTNDQTTSEIAQSIITTLRSNVGNLFPRQFGDHEDIIDFGGNESHVLDTSGTANLTQRGLPGSQSPRVPIIFSPSSQFQASEVALAARNAINNTAPSIAVDLLVNASVQTVAGRTENVVTLTHQTGLPSDVSFRTQSTLTGIPALVSRAVGNIIKQEKDLIRVIGHTVNDRGPLGFDNALQGDQFGSVADRLPLPTINDRTTAARGFSNIHEGIYIDDIIIGFAERGEMATGATTNASYVSNPDLSGTQVLTGEYQVEIRKSTDFGVAGSTSQRAGLFRSFDTNDRLAAGLTIIAQPGANIYDGQTFVISDGINSVTFEYNDTSVGNGIQTGRHPIPYTARSTDAEVAQTIRDAINSPTVQTVLPTLSAGLGDGTLVGVGTPTVSTTNRVNVYGPAHLTVHGNNGKETNDFIDEATETGIVGRNSPSFLVSGAIGDNQRHPVQKGLDVDLYRIQLFRGETISIDIDAEEIGSELDSMLRVFDAFGNQLAFDNATIAPSETSRRNFRDPFLSFTAPSSGTYFVGVSGQGNNSYDPNLEGSGVNSSIGFYQLELTFGAISAADFLVFDDVGDSNLLREQGQILIEANRIANSEQFGIRVDSAERGVVTNTLTFNGTSTVVTQVIVTPNSNGTTSTTTTTTTNTPTFVRTDILSQSGSTEVNSPPGPASPVRNLLELNTNGLVPGVVIENNVIFGGQQGAIHFSGNTRPAGEERGAVPFGRIVNNTLFGVSGTLVPRTQTVDIGILVDDFAAPTILNNIVANFNTGIRVVPDGVSDRLTVVGGQIYQGNAATTISGVASEDFAINLSNPDPTALPNGPNCNTDLHDANVLFVDAVNENFYLQPCSNAIDNSVGSLLDRADLVRVRAPLGISPSPILAPGNDVTGQKRVDDPNVETASGFGENVFTDRGAIDRADFAGPTANLSQPADNDADGVDLRSNEVSIVQLGQGIVGSSFEIRLVDGVEPADPTDGLGVDDRTVVSSAVVVQRDGVTLQDGVDYSFSYNATSDIIKLTPLSGIWKPDSLYTITLNNTDRFVIATPAGDELNDGDAILIGDFQPRTDRYEFESGYSLHVPQTLTVQVPAAGGRLGGIRDGGTFTVAFNDQITGLRTVTFEFDKDGSFNASNVQIPFTSVSTQDEIAISMVRALANANLGLTPVNLGHGRVHLGSRSVHQLTLPTTGGGRTTLTSVGVAGGVADGDQFTIDDGTRVVRFEFDSNGTTRPNVLPVPFNTRQTHEEIGRNLAAVVNQAIADGKIDAAGALRANHLGNGVVQLGGTPQHIVRTTLSNLTQSGTPGVSQAYGLRTKDASLRIQTPEAGLHLIVPQTGGAAIADGQSFTIRNRTGNSVRFEFDSNNSTTAGSVRVPFATSSDRNQVGNSIAVAIAGTTLGITPVNLGNGDIDLDTVFHVIDTTNSPTLRQTGIADGQFFTIDDGVTLTTFEFDSDQAPGIVTPGRIRIAFGANDSANQIGNAIVAAVNISNVGIDPLRQMLNLGNGLLDAGEPDANSLSHLWDTTSTNLGQTGVSGGIRDGETFQISLVDNSGFPLNTVTVELDRNGIQSPGNIIVVFGDTSTASDIANTMVPVLLSSGLGLNAIHKGLGTIDIGGTANHRISLANTPVPTHLTVLGSPGDNAAVSIPFVPSAAFTATDAAVALNNAINNDPLSRINVNANLGNGATVVVDGARSVSSSLNFLGATSGSIQYMPAIKDLATNNLKPNQLTGETQFTIVLGDVNLDYGDAADPAFQTVAGSNGAVHFISNGLLLGTKVDADVNGQPNLVASGDDRDAFIDLTLSKLVPLTPAAAPFAIQIPTGLQVPVTGSGIGGIADGNTLIIGDATRTITFEFDSDGNTQPTNVAISLTPGDQNSIANAIVTGIANQGLSLKAVNAGNGRIVVGIASNGLLNISGTPSLTRVAGVSEGETFGITDSTTGQTVTFQFDDIGTATAVAGNNIPVRFTSGSTLNQVADAVVTAIKSVMPTLGTQLVGLNPTNLGGGVVNIGGGPTHRIDTINTSLKTLGVPAYELQAPGIGSVIQTQPAGLKLIAPLFGGRVVTEGEQFTITSGSVRATFELDSDGNTAPGNFVINYTATSTQQAILNQIRTTIASVPQLALSPTDQGDGVLDLGQVSHTINLGTTALTQSNAAPFVIQAPAAGGAAIADGDTFTIRKGTNAPVRFEFDSNGFATSGNVRVVFTRFSRPQDIATALSTAIRNATSLDLTPEDLGGGALRLRGPKPTLDVVAAPSLTQAGLSDGQTFQIDDGDRVITFEFDSNGIAVPGNPTINIADNFTLLVPTAGSAPGGVANGQTFSIRNSATGVNRIFEFDTDGSVATGNTPVAITSLGSRDMVANAIVTAVAGATTLGLSPVHAGNGVVVLRGTTAAHSVDTTLTPSLSAGTRSQTLDELTVGIISAIAKAPLDPPLSPVYLGNGVVDLRSTSAHVIDVSRSNLATYGEANGVADGETFSITDGTKVVNYEFDFDGNVTIGNTPINLVYKQTIQIPAAGGGQGGIVDGDLFAINLGLGAPDVNFEFDSNGSTTPGNTVITFSNLSTQADLATLVANSIGSAGLGLSPQNLGDGRVMLALDGTDANTKLDTSGSATLTQFLTDDVATAVLNAITSSNFSSAFVVTSLGDGRIHVEGPSSHALNLAQSRLQLLDRLPSGIQTLSGANMTDGDSFIIGDGSKTVVFEFDNPTLSNGVTSGRVGVAFLPANSPSQIADAIVSAIESQGLALTATHVGNGLISLDGDDEDGVIFEGGLIRTVDTRVVVTASQPGLLDAWVDFNQDGDWVDAGEQIFASQPLKAGLNTLSIATPASAKLGFTTARFRLSTAGGLRPTGLAADGEVEDYQIRVITNVAPTVLAPISDVAALEDDPATQVSLTGIFGDVDITNGNADHLTLRVVSNSNPSLLTPTLAGTSLTLNFRPDQNGTANITVEARDQGGLTVTDTFTVVVGAVNDNPVVIAPLPDIQLSEDSAAISVNIGTAFSDPDIATNGDTLTYNLVSNDNPTLVQVSPNPFTGPVITLSVLPNQNGQASITVQAQDTAGNVVTDTFLVIVNAVNDAPTGVADSGSTNEDTPLTSLNVLSNDTDIDGDTLSIGTFSATSARGASVAITTTGDVTYNPTVSTQLQSLRQGVTQTDTFTYTATDGNGGTSAPVTVTITVTGVNDVPIALPDTASVAKDSQLGVTIPVLNNDSDPDNNALDITAFNTVNTIGSVGVVLLPSGQKAMSYSPNGQFNFLMAGETATTTFTYTISDGDGGQATALVTVTITGPNNQPTALNDVATTFEDQSVVITVLSNDSDIDPQPLTVTHINGNPISTGTPVAVGVRGGTATLDANNRITFSPNGRFEDLSVGTQAVETFSYTISDGNGGTATANVSVTVRGRNDAPNAVNDGYAAIQGGLFVTTDAKGTTTPTLFNDDGVLANDTDVDANDVLTVFLDSQPQHAASFTLNPNGTFSYRHDGSNTSQDSFTYVVDDGNGGSSVATVTITLAPRPPSVWQNPIDPLDVNNSGTIEPLDALIVINSLNIDGPRVLPNPAIPPNAPPPFYDVNGDGSISPVDVLLIINRLNNPLGQGEGEGDAFAIESIVTSTSISTPVEAGSSDIGISYGEALANYVLRQEDAASTSSLRTRLSDLVQSTSVDADAYRVAYEAALAGDDQIDFSDADIYDVLAHDSLHDATDVDDAIFGGDQDWL
ncbi:MAG: tandem-95 repeat protein [Planctomycetales bacterium]|nr:tandem-95 repeat protein [Planctomycetales bacterium]